MRRFSVDVRSAQGGESLGLNSFELIQELGKHELIHLETHTFQTGQKLWRTGHPTVVGYGQMARRKRELPAYVFSTRPTNGETAGRPGVPHMDITMLGSTMPMKNIGSGVWTNLHGWELVKRIAKAFRLTSRVDRVGSFFPVIRQDGRSYWELLADIARREGMLLYADGTSIHYRDPVKLERDRTLSAIPFVFGHGLRSVSGGLGEVEPKSASNKLFVLVDRRGETLASLPMAYNKRLGSSGPILQEDVISDELSSPDDELRAIERRNRSFFTARGLLNGDVRLRPGRVIYLDGVEGRLKGAWMVTRAVHEFTAESDDYTTKVGLQRSEVMQSYRTPPVRSSGGRVAVAGGHLGDPRTIEQNRSRLIRGRWAAA